MSAADVAFAPFSAETFQEFKRWIAHDSSRSRFTEEKRVEYRDWIRYPHMKPPPGPDQKRLWNHKYDAQTNYDIHDSGQLYRKPTPNERARGRGDRRVVTNTEIFDHIRDVHLQLEHAGVNKVSHAIAERYHGIRKVEVEWLLKRCQRCLLERQNRSRAPLEPIVSGRTLERVRIDLVDFRHEPDGQYKWILHIKDHFSMFTSLYPLRSKMSEEVANAIAHWIGCFGHPKIFECDNSREFKGYLLKLLQQYGIRAINGRPRTPRTQGLVEQANHTMKVKIRTWKADIERHGFDPRNWTVALPRMALAMNRQPHSSLGNKSAYEVFFGRQCRWPDAIMNRLPNPNATLEDIPEEEDGILEEDEIYEENDSHDEEMGIDDQQEEAPIAISGSNDEFGSRVPHSSTILDLPPHVLPVHPQPPPIPPRPTREEMLAFSPPQPALPENLSSPLPSSLPPSPPSGPRSQAISENLQPATLPPPLSSSPGRGSAAVSESLQPPAPPQQEMMSSLRSPPSLPPPPSENPLNPTAIEIQVQQHAAKARQRSADKYNKHHTIETFVPGDVVSIKVPREGRRATDPHRMFCRVLAVPHHNRYKLQTAHGVLNVHYPVTALNRVPPDACPSAAANIPKAELPNIITLHAAAARTSTSGRISVSCNCKPPRCTGKCRCLKNKVKCSIHCHATEFDCHNLSDLAIRPGVALADREREEEEEELPAVEDSELASFGDSVDVPPPCRKRPRQATPLTVMEGAVEGRVLRKRKRV